MLQYSLSRKKGKMRNSFLAYFINEEINKEGKNTLFLRDTPLKGNLKIAKLRHEKVV